MDRAAAASSDAPDVQSGEGSPQLTLPLHLPAEDFGHRWFDIRPVSFVTADRWYERWHYLGGAPQGSEYWGVFAPDLGAVVSIGRPNNVFGVATRYGLEDIPGNLEVNRVAVHPRMPGPTSRLMWLAIRAAQRVGGWSWCFSYADLGQNHHGGIYQALGAIYLGASEPRNGWKNAAGETLHPRSAVQRYGSQAKATMTLWGWDPVPGLVTPKHTYIIPVGPRAGEVRDRLAAVAMPYPKRDPGR